MDSISRRSFLHLSVAAAAAARLVPAGFTSEIVSPEKKKIGIYVDLGSEGADATFARISKLGFTSCELYTDQYGIEMAGPLKAAMKKYKIDVLALFTLGPGPTTWDFYEGQNTIGLVCREYREARVQALFQLSDLAKACGINMIETHVGYIPENPADSNYAETIESLKRIVGYCAKNNQTFLYHAGQESPTTALRAIKDVGMENQGIGMDTANLIMYDRGHPLHALDVYGKYIKIVSCKDGVYPVDPKNLGQEVPIGQGKVDFLALFNKLKEIGYDGPVIIEREGAREGEWEKDVCESREFLEKLIERHN